MTFDLAKLGVKRNIPKVNFNEYTGVIEAPEKFGKTTMASRFPNAVLLAFEKGYKAQVVDAIDINSWDDLVLFIDRLEQHRSEIGDSIQTIVFDTVDEAYPMAEPYMCKREGKKDGKKYHKKQDIAYGQGWGLHDLYFREQIKRIYNLGFAIQFITHSTTKTIKPQDGEEYTVHISTMPERLANIIYPECDYIMRGERRMIEDANGNKINKRVISLQGSQGVTGGNRVYFDGEIEFDTEEQAIERFQEKFTEKIQETLRINGIDTDIATLSKEQKIEKDHEVEEYIKTQKANKVDEDKNKELVAKVLSGVQTGTMEQKTAFAGMMKEHSISDLGTLETYPTAIVEELASIFN